MTCLPNTRDPKNDDSVQIKVINPRPRRTKFPGGTGFPNVRDVLGLNPINLSLMQRKTEKEGLLLDQQIAAMIVMFRQTGQGDAPPSTSRFDSSLIASKGI